MIPGSDASALSANFPNNYDKAFNLFFIHCLASPFYHHCWYYLPDIVIDTVGSPNKDSIKTLIAIPRAVNIDTIVMFLEKGSYSLTKCPSFFI